MIRVVNKLSYKKVCSITEFLFENSNFGKLRIFVPFNAIPKIVINSFLSAEDKNFFSHPGVDAKGVLRAVLRNISNIMTF